MLVLGFISISPKSRYLIGISYKQISSFLLFTVKDEERGTWVMDKPLLVPMQKIKRFFSNDNLIE